MNWLKERRKALNLTQEALAAKLQLQGFAITPGAISHWETGKHHPPLDDSTFRVAFAHVLGMDVRTVLRLSGYEVAQKGHTETGERAAYLVDQLPPDKQDLALRLLEQLAK